MESKANSKAADRIDRPVLDSPKPKGLKVKTNIKAGPHALLATGGD